MSLPGPEWNFDGVVFKHLRPARRGLSGFTCHLTGFLLAFRGVSSISADPTELKGWERHYGDQNDHNSAVTTKSTYDILKALSGLKTF